MRRKWIKLYCEKWLQGSIRQEALEVRAVFTDLLAVAGDSSFGEDGRIQIAPNVGFNDEAISALLNIPLGVWLPAKERLSNHPDEKENRIEVLPLASGFAIQILNWKLYQSDYSKLRDYQKEYLRRKHARAHSSPLDHHSSLEEGELKKKKEKEKKRKNIDVLSRDSMSSSISSSISSPLNPEENSLPPIPKRASFKAIAELEELRKDIHDQELLAKRHPNSSAPLKAETLKKKYLDQVAMYDR